MFRLKVLLLVLFTVGCATAGGLRPGGGSTFDVYNRNYDEVWKAVVTVVSRSLTIVESDKASGVVKAEKRAGLATWGEVVGIFVMPPNSQSDRYVVEVVSKKKMRTQLTGQDWRATIIAGVKAELGI